jgi:hypothetical protein
MGKETNSPWEGAKEVESNWFKFLVVGDKIKGTLINKRFQKGDEIYPDQWVYELKNDEGIVYNVGISSKKEGTIQRLNQCKMGEIIGILFDKEGESGVKGGAKAKYLKVFSFGMDESYKVEKEFNGEVSDIEFD